MIAALLVLSVLVFLIVYRNRKPAAMPPGSYGLPFLGDLPPKHMSITAYMRILQKKYGPIFTTKWGSLPIVVLADHRHIKKAFKHPDIQGRAEMNVFKVYHFYEEHGMVGLDGPLYAQNHRFFEEHLSKLGMGKTALEGSIHEEAAMLVDHLDKSCVDKPATMDVFINLAINNILWQLVASTRYEIDDELRLRYFRVTEKILIFLQGNIFLFEIFPALWKYLPYFVLNKLFGLDDGFRSLAEIHEMSRNLVRDHLKTLDPNNPRDVIDYYALKHPERDPSGFLTPDNETELVANMFDLFFAGSETTAASIRWLLLYMAMYPDVQAKVHKCLDAAVPRDRQPSLADREQLQYLDAVIQDSLRLSSLVPLGVSHRATADVQLEGYTIPKDTIVMACSEICHRDGALWERPHDLHPGHFLDEDGKLRAKVENFLPFSAGRRQCIGEPLARMELYIFVAAILQRFTVQPPEGVALDMQPDPSQYIVNFPKPFEVVLRRRA